MTSDDYLREVGFDLRDLPWRQREELLTELRNHLAELPSDTDLEARLGTPAHYTAELRAAAALPRHRGLVAFFRSCRPRNIALVAAPILALALVLAGAGWIHHRNAWVNSYQPLDFAGGYRYPPGKSLLGLDGVQATFHPGRPFNFGMTVVNDGRFAVRILGVPFGNDYDPWKARLMMSRTLPDTGGMHGPYVPFRPFDLPPERVVFLFFEGRYACPGRQAAGATVYSEFPVTYAFRGRTRTASIPLPEPFAIYMPKGCR